MLASLLFAQVLADITVGGILTGIVTTALGLSILLICAMAFVIMKTDLIGRVILILITIVIVYALFKIANGNLTMQLYTPDWKF